MVIDGVPLSELSVREIHQFRNEKMGYVFQFHHLLPELTVIYVTHDPLFARLADRELVPVDGMIQKVYGCLVCPYARSGLFTESGAVAGFWKILRCNFCPPALSLRE